MGHFGRESYPIAFHSPLQNIIINLINDIYYIFFAYQNILFKRESKTKNKINNLIFISFVRMNNRSLVLKKVRIMDINFLNDINSTIFIESHKKFAHDYEIGDT